MKISSSIADLQSTYGSEKTSQTSSKPFVIPVEELTEEKPKQTYKATQSVSSNLKQIGYLTYIGGYDKFDPFKDIAKTGSFEMPNGMQTKTTPTRSNEEILKDMEELAKEHARTGQFQDSDPRFSKLMNEYISSVSPDRESILKSSIDEMLERIESEMSGTVAEDAAEEAKKKKEELINYLMEAIDTKNGKGKNNIIATRSDGYYTAVDIDRGDGKVTTLIYDNQGNKQPWLTVKSDMYEASAQNGVVTTADFYDNKGEIIASYNENRGLRHVNTKTEYERMQEVLGVYNKAYKELTNKTRFL